MRRIALLILSLVSCMITFADQRGVTFEKDGLRYVISSEVTARRFNTHGSDEDPKYIIANEGEVYVCGVTVSDCVVKIPDVVYAPSTYGRKDTTVMAKYYVLGIGEKAFEGARLKDLIIPFRLRFIGNEAFHNLEITNGVLVVPPVWKMKANVFDGVKAKVFFMDLKCEMYGNPSIIFENTFQNKNNLPDFYIPHSCLNVMTNGLDKKIFYSVGKNIYTKWIEISWEEILRDKSDYSTYKSLSINSDLFYASDEENVPQINIKTRKKYDKNGTDIDMLPPYEYVCKNSYTHKKDVYDEVLLSISLFRCKKADKYFYFSLEGKPITDVGSLLDDSGRDPFGLQVYSKEEMKAKNANKEKEKNLNNKLNDLKKAFGL